MIGPASIVFGGSGSAEGSPSALIAEHATRSTLITEKSTVPVQTGAWIEKTLAVYRRRPGVEFDVASNPEFTREASAVEDFLSPDRVVIGIAGPAARGVLAEDLRRLYEPLGAQIGRAHV